MSKEGNRVRPKRKYKGHMGKGAKRSAVAHARRVMLQKECLKLRVQGLSERQIAEQLVKDGIVAKFSGASVNQLLAEALDQVLMPEAEKLKKLELARLDHIINGHYGNAVAGDVGATHAVLACIDRRNRLLGIGQEMKVSSQTLGADGKPVDPVRPVIHLTIAQSTPVIDHAAQPIQLPERTNGHSD